MRETIRDPYRNLPESGAGDLRQIVQAFLDEATIEGQGIDYRDFLHRFKQSDIQLSRVKSRDVIFVLVDGWLHGRAWNPAAWR
jgi:hypothetical protein